MSQNVTSLSSVHVTKTKSLFSVCILYFMRLFQEKWLKTKSNDRTNINLEIFKTICDNILHLTKSPDIFLSVKLVNCLAAPKLPLLTSEIAVFKSEEWSQYRECTFPTVSSWLFFGF